MEEEVVVEEGLFEARSKLRVGLDRGGGGGGRGGGGTAIAGRAGARGGFDAAKKDEKGKRGVTMRR